MSDKYYQIKCVRCGDNFSSLHWSCKRCEKCMLEMQIIKKTHTNYGRIKELKYESSCKHCKEIFKHSDTKAKTCKQCSEQIEIICKCGCGKKFMKTRWKAIKTPYWTNHSKKGKTYLEIYGTNSPGCGFKSGLENPNFTNMFTKLKISNERGEKFRSKLELKFADFLYENSIPYKNEVIINMLSGKKKIVDFVVFDTILIEISGFSYDTWREKFISQMISLRDSVYNPILVLTYDFNLQEDSKIWQIPNFDIFIRSGENYNNVLKSINFHRRQIFQNVILHGDKYYENLIKFNKNNLLCQDGKYQSDFHSAMDIVFGSRN